MLPQSQPSKSTLIFLLPSARDIIFILLFWSILAGPLSQKPLADADIGWHIRTGEQILATQSIPRTDDFSSTVRGQPWFAWEWLYDVLLGLLYRSTGLNGIVWLAALIIAITMTLLIGQLVKTGTGLPMAILLMLLVEMAAAIHLFARPHIVSWLFTLIWLIVLERWENSGITSSRFAHWLPWFFPACTVLWVNLHGGWLFGLAVLAAYALGSAIEALRQHNPLAQIRIWHRARRMGLTLVASAAATLVNPHGWWLHGHIFHYLGDRYLMNKIEEFRSPNFHGWPERAFAAILVLTMLAFLSKLRRLPISHLLIALLASFSGLYASRNLPVSSIILVLVAGPLLWEAMTLERPGAWRFLRALAASLKTFAQRMDAQELQLRGHLWPAVAVIVALLACLRGGQLGSWQLVHSHFDSAHLPVKAADYLAQEPGDDPVFAPDSWGGYFIYRLYPNRRVVMDDRHDLYGSDRVRDYLLLVQVESGWKDVLNKWQIHTVVFPRNSTLIGILRELPKEWHVVYEDKVAVIMEKQSR